MGLSVSLQNHQISSSCVKTLIRLLKPPQQSKQKAALAADKEAAGQEMKKDDAHEPSQEPTPEGEGREEEAPPGGEQPDGERQQPHAVVDLQVCVERERERAREREQGFLLESASTQFSAFPQLVCYVSLTSGSLVVLLFA